MARIIKGRRQTLYVWRNIQLTKSRLLLFTALLVLALVLFTLNVFPYATFGVVMTPLAYLLGVYSYKSYLAWSGGSLGERLVVDELDRLDDSFTVISGVVVPPNRGDTDHIVLGRNGIFVVETKNVGGEVSCNRDEWSRMKTGRGGGVYELKIGSPSNQAKRNAKVLKDFLLKHQARIFEKKAPHIWVNSVVVFTNRDVKLDLKSPTVDVLKTPQLSENIRESRSESRYSAEEIERMKEVILEYAR